MKIAYLAFIDVSRESGVLKKISGQTRTWRSMGHDVRLFAASPRVQPWEGLGDLAVEAVRSSRTLTNIMRTPGLVERVLAWGPDVVYHRFHLYYPRLVRMMHRKPTCLEIVADDVAQHALTQPWYEDAYHRRTRHKVIRAAAGFVCITQELAEKLPVGDRPVCVIGDGIRLADFRPAPPPGNTRPVVVSIASNPRQAWIGADKLLRLAAACPEWAFHVVGCTREQLPGAVPSNLTAHGFLARTQYEPLLASADAAIGSLALHRIGMNESSPLKTREYLAMGLPTVIGYRDTDFPDGAPFLLRIPNTDDSIETSLERIRTFVHEWKGRRVPREAVAHLDTNVKELRRLEFLERVRSGRA